jgi:glycosyltransferase involved in cell wall biosynthesis
MQGQKLLFVVNVDWFMVSHRLPIAIAAVAAGWEVHIACAVTDKAEILESHGLIVHDLCFSRQGTSIYQEGKTFIALFKLIKKIKPDVTHLVTIKPVLYGGLALRLCGLSAAVASISGLGYIFMANGRLAALRRNFILMIYRLALAHKKIKIIFQNPDDKKILSDANVIAEDNAVLIRGSGVDLNAYQYLPEPDGVPVVVLLARLLRDKGVFEFVQAAEIIKRKGIDVRFLLIGDIDANPTSVQAAEIKSWVDMGTVEWLGHRSDIIELLQNAHLVVLPSYREGLPKALIEAAACGRAVVTTDVPGCRDAIEAGVTGLLVPVRDEKALALAIEKLLLDTSLRYEMGKNGRLLAERCFSINTVIDTHLNIYKDLVLL